jgi:hypothetical protein
MGRGTRTVQHRGVKGLGLLFFADKELLYFLRSGSEQRPAKTRITWLHKQWLVARYIKQLCSVSNALFLSLLNACDDLVCYSSYATRKSKKFLQCYSPSPPSLLWCRWRQSHLLAQHKSMSLLEDPAESLRIIPVPWYASFPPSRFFKHSNAFLRTQILGMLSCSSSSRRITLPPNRLWPTLALPCPEGSILVCKSLFVYRCLGDY